jgi:hypothetical protein
MLCGVIAGACMLVAIVCHPTRAFTIAKAFDKLGNAVGFGGEDELISARAWRMRDDPLYALLVRIINYVSMDPKHCMKAARRNEEKEVRNHEHTTRGSS